MNPRQTVVGNCRSLESELNSKPAQKYMRLAKKRKCPLIARRHPFDLMS